MWSTPSADGFNYGAVFSEDGKVVHAQFQNQNTGFAGTSAFRMATGERLFTTVSKSWNYMTNKPLLVNGILVLPATKAVNATTGAPLWKYEIPADASLSGFGYVVVPNTGKKVVVVGTSQTLTCLDLTTGRQLWRYKVNINSTLTVFNPSANSEGQVFAIRQLDSGDSLKFLSFDAFTGKVLWEASLDDSLAPYTYSGSPIVANGVVYMGAYGGQVPYKVVALDAQTGHQLDAWSFGGAFVASNNQVPFFADNGILFVGDQNGYVSAIKLLK